MSDSSRAWFSGERLQGRRYKPFPIDWRFLPEPALLAKDWLRRQLATSSNWAAIHPCLKPVWRRTIGLDTLNAVLRARYLFIHIPKTSGTSISACLYGKNLPPYTAQFYQEVFGDLLADIPSFAVIRHPLDRLVSLYDMAVNGGTEILAFDRVETVAMRGFGSFSHFVDYLHANRERTASLPGIAREQAEFVQDGRGRTMVNRLFAMDRSKGPPGELASWLGVKDFPHLNASLRQRANLRPGDQIKIRQIYERDFDLYQSLVGP